ncbi:MAG: hypothetical protein HYS05_18400 [Acidobacteria bacterium]|nr:hypothetical protein [Acidobacteriota bacterium]
MSDPRPSLVILAGPNGAGKSTVAPALLHGASGQRVRQCRRHRAPRHGRCTTAPGRNRGGPQNVWNRAP